MNTIEQITIRAPSGRDDVCAKITVDNTDTPFVLYDTTVEELQYTLGFYAKSDTPGEMTVGDTTFATGTEWQRYVVLFVAEEEDTAIYFNTSGTYYFYHIKLEVGNKDTDWSPNPEDIEETACNLEERLKSAELKLTKDGIVGIVSGYYAVNTEVEENFKKISTTVTQTAKDLTVKTNDAAKTATNFLKYDGGLIVGEIPQTDDATLGNNVLITTNDVQIRNGETVFAKYAGNQIDLGCSGDISTINLLNGAGKIKAVDNLDYNEKDIEIIGMMCATLMSPEVASLTAEKGDYVSYVRCFTNENSPMVGICAVDPTAGKSGSIRVNTENILIYTGGIVEIEGALTTTGNITSNRVIASDNIQTDGRIKSQGTYDYTSTQAANMGIFSSYWTFRSTSSSKRYKHDIKGLEEGLNSEKLLNIPVHQYIYNLDYVDKSDQRYGVAVPGFVAEEVFEHYPIAAEIADGQIEDWNYRMIIPPMLDLIQKVWKRVNELEKNIS